MLGRDNIIILNIIIEPESPTYLYLLYKLSGDILNYIIMSLYTINGITSNSGNIINSNNAGKATAYEGNYDFTAYYIENPT